MTGRARGRARGKPAIPFIMKVLVTNDLLKTRRGERKRNEFTRTGKLLKYLNILKKQRMVFAHYT